LSPCLVQAGEYEQKQGPAAVRLQAEKVESGQVEMRLSDTLPLTLSVEGKATLEAEAVQPFTPSKDWQIRRQDSPRREPLPDGRVRWRQTFILMPLKPGDLALPLAPLRFREDADVGRWQEVVWQPIPVRVVTEILTPGLGEMRDVTPPEEVPSAPSWRQTYALAALAATVFGVFLASGLAWRRRRQQPVAVPPEQWALRELDRIQSQPHDSAAAIEQFHIQISDVVRRYLELRFQLPAPEQTTVEFLARLRQASLLTPEQQALLREFLERCDLVKFARLTPNLEECATLAATARGLVEQTTVPRIHEKHESSQEKNGN
jgi:hypothetical protein